MRVYGNAAQKSKISYQLNYLSEVEMRSSTPRSLSPPAKKVGQNWEYQQFRLSKRRRRERVWATGLTIMRKNRKDGVKRGGRGKKLFGENTAYRMSTALCSVKEFHKNLELKSGKEKGLD